MIKFLTKMQGYKHFGYFCLMNLSKRILNFYLDASVHIALSVVCLVKITEFFFNIPVNNHVMYFSFFGTISCYNFVKYGVEAKKYFIVSSAYQKRIQFFSILALCGSLYHIFFFTKSTLLVLILCAFLTGLYALPILPKATNFRSLSGFKIFMVALVWTGVTVILPVVEAGYDINVNVLVESFQRILLVIILLIPFEIRDLKFDSPELGTMPQRYGVTNSKLIGAFAAVLFFFITYVKENIWFVDVISKGVLFLLLWIVLFITKRNQKKYFASFWVEAIPIFWYILIAGWTIY